MEIAILFLSFFALLFLGFPIAFCLMISSLATVIAQGLPIDLVFQRMVSGIQVFSLLAVPFFIFAGEIIARGGLAKIIVDLASVLVGRVRGGLGLVNIVSSMFFGGISGSAVADTSAIGSVMIPMMEEKGYDKDFAVNVTISSSIIGVIIPPSHNMILYAVAAGGGVSIGSLFMAGIIPGILVGLALMLVTYYIAVKRSYPVGEKFEFKAMLSLFLKAAPGLFTLVIIMGGILSGLFTATESACIAVLYALLISKFIYKSLSHKVLVEAMKGTIKTTTMVFFIIAAANAFGWLMAYYEIPDILIEFLTSLTDSKTIIILLIVMTLIVLGTFMDMAPLIVITTPIFLPIVTELGMDPVHFGIIMMMCLGIGLITPPVGTVLFAGASLGKISVEKLIVNIWPFYLVLFITLLIVLFVPSLTMISIELFK